MFSIKVVISPLLSSSSSKKKLDPLKAKQLQSEYNAYTAQKKNRLLDLPMLAKQVPPAHKSLKYHVRKEKPSIRTRVALEPIMHHSPQKKTGQFQIRGKTPSSSNNSISKSLMFPSPVEAEILPNSTFYQFHFMTTPGYDNGRNKKNQDSIAIVTGLGENASLFCVFDGHGVAGHEVSAFLKQEVKGRLK